MSAKVKDYLWGILLILAGYIGWQMFDYMTTEFAKWYVRDEVFMRL